MEFSSSQYTLIAIGGVWFLGFTLPVYYGVARRTEASLFSILFGIEKGCSLSVKDKTLVAIGMAGGLAFLACSAVYQ